MRPRLVVLLAVVVCALIGGVAIFSPNGFSGLRRLQTEEEALRHDVEQKEAQNKHLADEIEVLRGDDAAARALLEKKAREELGYVGPGEVILKIPIDDADADPAADPDADPAAHQGSDDEH